MTQQRSERDQFLDQYQAAMEASGLPTPETVMHMVLDINAGPEKPPTDSALWPVHSFVRHKLAENVPLNWLMAQGLEDIDARLLKKVEEDAFRRLEREGKIEVTIALSLRPEEVEDKKRGIFSVLVQATGERDPRKLAEILRKAILYRLTLEPGADGQGIARGKLRFMGSESEVFRRVS